MKRIHYEAIGDPLGDMFILIWVDGIPYGLATDEESAKAVLRNRPPREPKLGRARPKKGQSKIGPSVWDWYGGQDR